MGRKLAILCLILMLTMGLCPQALAGTHACRFLASIDYPTASLTETAAFRSQLAGLLLLDHLVAVPGNGLYEVQSTGDGIMLASETTIDIYYPVGEERYMALSLRPGEAVFENLGTVAMPQAEGAMTFSLADMWAYISQILSK